MNTIRIKTISLFLFTVAFGMSACDDKGNQLELLTKENTELRDNYQKQLLETRMFTEASDSLQTVAHSLLKQIQKMKGDMPVYNASSEDEKAIEELVGNLHKGWTSMLEKDDTRELLKYFLSKYTTSSVRINTENIPSVQRSNDANFVDHLNELMLTTDVSLSFGQTKFLYTEVKGNIFATSYRTRLRVYQNNKQTHTSSLITQLAGEKKEDGWKVGSYHWVTFNYE
ncbi:MAG: hypothetical protein MI975_07660 [Cytophagales bacterium]|nr:hypothetical protein [Cytophagales bacterium]